ncbi:uncharacterized protein IUM83_06206 [Phytophthora cinnamomi]|uniref:uncharacterized protein n=1 Tax=Phytophthora cinnamomi TaxID=4785 RepID=UPI00355A8B93|nr:hypothetical protein IUM83_06206 [Phytophthora cinnamomi]
MQTNLLGSATWTYKSPAEPDTATPSRVEHTCWSSGASFASAALVFLAEVNDSYVEFKPEYVQVLELIVDWETREAGDLPAELKEFCIGEVTTLISTFVDEGPSYQFTPRMALHVAW